MRRFVLALSISLLVMGCEERLGPERVATVPVSGMVFVGGAPVPDVKVTCTALEAKNDGGRYTSESVGITDKDGRFVISTYQQGDGLAAGTYAITFQWLTYNALKNQWGGADKLNGKYSDPKMTEHKLTVTGDEEMIDLEPFVLSAK